MNEDCSPNVIMVIGSRRMEWAEHVALWEREDAGQGFGGES